MNRLEQRVKRLEEEAPQGPCDHGLVILVDPTEEELEERRKELRACPRCREGDGPKMVILKCYGEGGVNRNGY